MKRLLSLCDEMVVADSARPVVLSRLYSNGVHRIPLPMRVDYAYTRIT